MQTRILKLRLHTRSGEVIEAIPEDIISIDPPPGAMMGAPGGGQIPIMPIVVTLRAPNSRIRRIFGATLETLEEEAMIQVSGERPTSFPAAS
jgi:hypothetical protein